MTAGLQAPPAGQLTLVVDRLPPPVTLKVNVVDVWPLLLKVTVPLAAVGEVLDALIAPL